MMIELRSYAQLSRAVEGAKKMKPFVRVVGFRWYTVRSSNGQDVYTIHFYDRGIPGRLLSECTCPAGERGLICYHVAGASAIHLGIESMRRAA